ncbi:hypothetical protein V8C26DRAFT_393512 [Trichoderma gracile]
MFIATLIVINATVPIIVLHQVTHSATLTLFNTLYLCIAFNIHSLSLATPSSSATTFSILFLLSATSSHHLTCMSH